MSVAMKKVQGWFGVGMAASVMIAAGCGGMEEEDQGARTLGMVSGEASVEVCGESTTTTLLAGQHIEAGTVEVSNDEEALYVTFSTVDGWLLTETHVAVGASLSDLPQNKAGNPIPGHFEYKEDHDPAVRSFTYTISLDGLEVGEELYIAAHAAMVLVDEEGNVVQGETGWGEGPGFSGRNWAMYFHHTVQECEDGEEPALQGCTPGYWRQSHHFDNWVGFSPADDFGEVVDRDVELSLRRTISAQGGDLYALLRHTTAALLNAANPEVNYPYTVEEVVELFQNAYDAGEYEWAKDLLDEANNLGCPL